MKYKSGKIYPWNNGEVTKGAFINRGQSSGLIRDQFAFLLGEVIITKSKNIIEYYLKKWCNFLQANWKC